MISRFMKKSAALLLAVAVVISALTFVPGLGTVESSAAGWNGTNYGGGTLYGYRTFLEAFGIDYDTYMKWMDDHDADSPNPHYYLGTPYEENDHRNPNGDCSGAYGDYDESGVAAMNCTGFVWHVLYKSAVMSGASAYQINQLKVMWEVPVSWANLGVYRIYFDSLEDAYDSGVLEKGDLMWIYGSDDNHNTIFYGDDPHDFIYWDSAGEENRYCEVHAIGDCLGLWVAKVTQPNEIELHINTRNADSSCFGAKYSVFNSYSEAQAAAADPDSDAKWDKRIGTIALDSSGYGFLRTQSAPSKAELWRNGVAQTRLSYFSSAAERVNARNTYYAVQWSPSSGILEENTVHVFKDTGQRTPTGYKIYGFNISKKVGTPAFTTAKTTYDGIKFKWKAVRGAERYRIYYKSAKGPWVRMAETTSTSYIDKKVNSGSSYTYTIRCVDIYGNFTSSFNTAGWKVLHKVLDTPKLSSGTSVADGIKLKWSAVSGASKYRVYYKNSKGSWTRLTTTSATEFTDSSVSYGQSRTYTIRCVDNDGDFVSGFNSTGWKRQYTGVATPSVKSLVSEAGGVRLSWDAVEGASKYRVYCKNASGSWSKIGDTASTEYLDEVVTAGKSYTYTVRCLNKGGKLSSSYNSKGWTQKYDGIATPVISEAVSTDGGIRLKWDAVEGAYKYRIYYKNYKGVWAKMAETAKTEYLDAKVTPGTSYTYTIRCVNKGGRFSSSYNNTGIKCTYTLTTPVIKSAENTSSGIKLSWNKINGAYGYRVFYYGSKGWQRLATVTGASYTDTDVRSGNSYIYTVRCIDKNGSYVSDFDHSGFKAQFIATPRISKISNGTEGVELSWEPVKGAYAYRVFVKTSSGWSRLGVTSSASYTDTSAESGKTYTYTVRCMDKDGSYVSSYDSAGTKTTFTAAPKVSELYGNSSGMVLKWNAVKGAYSYRVFRLGSSGWERLGVTTGTTYTDKTAENGGKYTYTVRCMDKSGSYISAYYSGFTATYIKYIDFTLSGEDDGVKVSWTKLDGIDSYTVFRLNDSGKFISVARTFDDSWTDTSAADGQKYIYTLRGRDESGSFITGFITAGKDIVYEKPETPTEDMTEAA